MKKFAVIDVGSNSVRLMFVADGKVLYKRLNTTRLGEGIARSPFLKEEAIVRSAVAVADFYAQAKAEGAETVRAFATAAVRSAKNGKTFVDKVKTLCALDVEIISGETEAELGILGALGNADGAVLDIGGASTELVVKKGGAIVYKKSVNVGVVRLKDMCDRDETALKQATEAAVKEFGNVPADVCLYAIGGTATTIGALAAGMEKYESNKVTGTVLTLETSQAMTKKLLSLSVAETATLPCVSPGREDILAGGAVWLSAIMENLGFMRLIVSDRDNLEGYAIKNGLMN